MPGNETESDHVSNFVQAGKNMNFDAAIINAAAAISGPILARKHYPDQQIWVLAKANDILAGRYCIVVDQLDRLQSLVGGGPLLLGGRPVPGGAAVNKKDVA